MNKDNILKELEEWENSLIIHKPFKLEDDYYRGQWDAIDAFRELIKEHYKK